MKLPDLSCGIEISSLINPSEDPKKIKTAILNIFPNVSIKFNKISVISNSTKLVLLEKFFDEIYSKNLQKIFHKQLEKNLLDCSTWVYLNKQAAFVGNIVICEYPEESPLGPIKVILNSEKIDEIINLLAFGDKNSSYY